jgi:hypothetical protein
MTPRAQGGAGLSLPKDVRYPPVRSSMWPCASGMIAGKLRNYQRSVDPLQRAGTHDSRLASMAQRPEELDAAVNAALREDAVWARTRGIHQARPSGP